MKFVNEPNLLTQFLTWIIDKIYDFYYCHWGFKHWDFGKKWNAILERENFVAMLKDKGFTFEKESE